MRWKSCRKQPRQKREGHERLLHSCPVFSRRAGVPGALPEGRIPPHTNPETCSRRGGSNIASCGQGAAECFSNDEPRERIPVFIVLPLEITLICLPGLEIASMRNYSNAEQIAIAMQDITVFPPRKNEPVIIQLNGSTATKVHAIDADRRRNERLAPFRRRAVRFPETRGHSKSQTCSATRPSP